MDVEVKRDGFLYKLHFETGENIGGLHKEKAAYKYTGTKIHWKPDSDVFTEVNLTSEYFHDILKRQAVVNKNLEFVFYDEIKDEKHTYLYEDGIIGYVNELAAEK